MPAIEHIRILTLISLTATLLGSFPCMQTICGAQFVFGLKMRYLVVVGTTPFPASLSVMMSYIYYCELEDLHVLLTPSCILACRVQENYIRTGPGAIYLLLCCAPVVRRHLHIRPCIANIVSSRRVGCRRLPYIYAGGWPRKIKIEPQCIYASATFSPFDAVVMQAIQVPRPSCQPAKSQHRNLSRVTTARCYPTMWHLSKSKTSRTLEFGRKQDFCLKI